MSEPQTPAALRSSPLYRTLLIFVAGITLGALMMVEVVPASELVEIRDIGAIQRLPDGTAVDPDDPDAPPGGGENGQGPVVGGPDESGNGSTSGEGGSSDTGEGQTGSNQPNRTGNDAGIQGSGGAACAPGQNGGATDQGVTATGIQMATTVVESGVGSSFLGEVRIAMDAVVNRVNREGGICGRQMSVTYRDDGWSPDRGAQFLQNFINQKSFFAIPVGPSSEGLNLVIGNGDFDRAQLPVVGTNGLIETQYEDGAGNPQQWVWPVAAATVSSARIMAKDAYDRMAKAGVDDGKPGAENFSVVFAHNYRFGREGADAFNSEVRRLTGQNIDGYDAGGGKDATSCTRSYCAITAGDGATSYSQQVGQFRPGQFVALFLEPQTARAWMTDNNAPAADDASIPFGFGAAQPLFTQKFGEDCGTKCHKMLVWTGFKPFQEQYLSDPDVQRYVNDLHTTNRNADENNQFSMGAYIGMELLVEAIREVGPDLTRVRLKQALDNMTFNSGLTLADPMTFSADNRFVAIRMQAWEKQAIGEFRGWRPQQIVTDPRFG